MKIIDTNKKAYFDYEILETLEAGIVLTGAEVKSLRQGNANLKDAFCFMENGEMVLKNCHISPYEKGSYFNLDARRDRKLLLHRREINRLGGKANEKGLTIVPLKLYFKQAMVKVEVGLAKGKHSYDKRDSLRKKDLDRDAERQIKEWNR